MPEYRHGRDDQKTNAVKAASSSLLSTKVTELADVSSILCHWSQGLKGGFHQMTNYIIFNHDLAHDFEQRLLGLVLAHMANLILVYFQIELLFQI
jgi:hypothetical protein